MQVQWLYIQSRELTYVRLAFRLFPPFPILHRIALHDTTLPSGGGQTGTEPIFVMAGSRATTCTYSLHRNTGIFGPNTEDFKPDRWNSIQPQPWEFLPFSYGARSCLGQDKARIEAAYILCVMAQRFAKLESRDDRAWKGESKLSVRNAHGVLVGLST